MFAHNVYVRGTLASTTFPSITKMFVRLVKQLAKPRCDGPDPCLEAISGVFSESAAFAISPKLEAANRKAAIATKRIIDIQVCAETDVGK